MNKAQLVKCENCDWKGMAGELLRQTTIKNTIVEICPECGKSDKIVNMRFLSQVEIKELRNK